MPALPHAGATPPGNDARASAPGLAWAAARAAAWAAAWAAALSAVLLSGAACKQTARPAASPVPAALAPSPPSARSAPDATAATAAPADTPRLVVIVVIDQCRADYLARPELQGGALAALVRDGAWFPDAAHTHTATFTAPGHAAIATGCLPARAGLPANDWYDRGRRSAVYCVDDGHAPLVGLGLSPQTKGVSPACLERPTLGDVLQAERGDDALVISVGWKDRSAVLLGGRHSDGSYWIDPSSGRWVTSSALRPTLPAALGERCAEPIRELAGRSWERRAADACLDDAPGERPPAGFGNTFPHVLPQAPGPGGDLTTLTELVGLTPFADALVERAASVELDDEPLGQDDLPDLLCVAFAALDYSGHYFGPRSCEVSEVLRSVDEQLGRLVAQLDARVGRGRWTLALTADHGVQPVPEQSGGRRLDGIEQRRSLEAALCARFGDPPPRPGEARPRWIAAVIRPSLWLDQERIAAARLDPEVVARFAADTLAALPGIAQAATRSQLAALLASADAAADASVAASAGASAHARIDADLLALARDVHPTRSGDVLFLLEPGVMIESDVAATHGTQNADDRRVPLLLYGAGIAPGVYPGPAAPIDIAPTLARLLGLKGLADADGQVLQAALAPGPSSRATPP